MPRARRKASHAGSWYTDNGSALSKDIETWLSTVPADIRPSPRAIIAPHAGYRYSGHVMAYAYKHLNPDTISRVFLLGPSHHVYSQRCMLSAAASYSTPFGDIAIDSQVYQKLTESALFQFMSLKTDEAEHSLELHLPYIAHVLRGKSFTLVPIMVGALTPESEAEYGQLLAPYLQDPSNTFIVSSDFCHWGFRFNYMFYDESQAGTAMAKGWNFQMVTCLEESRSEIMSFMQGSISESIQWLDFRGIEAILTGQPEPFQQYLQKYSNTICGRHPIGVLLNMFKHIGLKPKITLTKYDQSGRCTQKSDSSVSYASLCFLER